MRYKNNSGAAMIIVVTISAVLFGMLALSADMGYLFLARNQLQNAADAGALGGASQLLYLFPGGNSGSAAEAERLAREYAMRHLAADRPVEDADIQVDISANAQDFKGTSTYTYAGPAIRVIVSRTNETNNPITLFFGQVLGVPKAGVGATAVARLVPAGGICGIRPWAIRDKDLAVEPDWVIGLTTTLKYSAQGDPRETPNWFSPVQFPPVTKPTCGNPQPGANAYKDNIMSGSSCDCLFGIGDIFRIQTGDMVGPTVGGVRDLIGKVVPVLLFQFDDYSSSDKTVEISRIGTFRIEDVVKTGAERGNIIGSFAGLTTIGGVPGGLPNDKALVFTVQLIR